MRRLSIVDNLFNHEKGLQIEREEKLNEDYFKSEMKFAL